MLTKFTQKPAAPAIPAERLHRPNLGPNVRLHPPMTEGQSWFLQRGTHQYYAVAPDFARLAGALDGQRTHRELAELLGPPWAERDVAHVVDRLADSGLLDDGKQKARRDSWFRFVPPMTVQLKVLNPAPVLARLAPLIQLLANRGGAAVGLGAVLLGLIALVAQAGAISNALSQRLPFATYLAVLAGVLLTTAVHEMGHGAVLTYYGGRPNRMGVMLFYLSPAFFCDVSDGWRLPRKEQRVHVALAGIAIQVIIASLAAVVAWVCGDSPARDALLVFTVSAYLAGLFNLIPFVKLDGYIALMCHVNVPHLRDRAMTDARRFLARILFGGDRYAKELPQLHWAIAYGLACLAFPVYLVLNGMVLWVDLFQRMGIAGATLMSFALCFLAYHVVRGFGRLIREGRAAGARVWRITAAAILAVIATGALLTYAKAPLTIAGGYVATADGRVDLVLATTTDPASIREGAQVQLYQAGLVTREHVGTGRVASTSAAEITAPLSAFLPVRADGVEVPATGYSLDVTTAPTQRIGAAIVDGGQLSLGEWLWAKYMAPALHW